MSKPVYDFRMRVELPRNDSITSEDQRVLVYKDPSGANVWLDTGARGTPIKANPRIVLRGGPFASEADALTAAESAKQGALSWGIFSRFGMDFGDGFVRGFLTDAGKERFFGHLADKTKNDVHGIDVFESDDDLVFVRVGAELRRGSPPDRLVQEVNHAMKSSPRLTPKETLSAELYLLSYFEDSFRSRFLTLVTAVEALLDPPSRPPEIVTLVEGFESTVKKSLGDSDAARSLLGALQWLKKESISRSGRQLAQSLLGGATYCNVPAETFFSQAYNLRSHILHTGGPEKKDTDMLERANDAQAFVGDLLTALFVQKGIFSSPP